jgi:hypothetical protein
MTMESFLRLVESSGLSIWIRESDSLLAFPGILVLHTLGMAFLAGAAVAIALPMLAAERPAGAETVSSLTPVAWAGFAANALSGVLLVVAYPTKALTNPIFYVKLAFIGLLISAFHLARRRFWWNKGLAAALLLLSILTIVGGRLLPYTYTRLLALD